jgi:hypothetical protein
MGLLFILKIVAAACLIALTSWIAKSNPKLAGFILALPVTTMIALAFSFAEFQNPEASVEFAKSTFYAIPLSLLFFVPFLLADRLKIGFWGLYSTGVFLLGVGYLIHKGVFRSA